jgi:predicted component of type VI protein secretion system
MPCQKLPDPANRPTGFEISATLGKGYIYMQVSLVVTNLASKESTSCDLTVEEKIAIGRHLGSPVLLQGDRLSRHHFLLMVVDGALTVEDLSSNGTWVNGELLKEHMSARVKSGDMIEVPGYEMQVRVQNADAPQSPQAGVQTAMVPTEPSSSRKRTLVAVALHILEPREAALLLFAVASFALISFFLNR